MLLQRKSIATVSDNFLKKKSQTALFSLCSHPRERSKEKVQLYYRLVSYRLPLTISIYVWMSAYIIQS